MGLYEKFHTAVQRLPSKSNSSSAIQESLAFYANLNVIILFTTACHLTCPERNESSPQPPISLSHIVIASPDICLSIPRDFFYLNLPTKDHLFIRLLPQTCHMPRPSHPPSFHPPRTNVFV